MTCGRDLPLPRADDHQAVFDYLVDRLREQGCRPDARHRDPQGRCSAAGFLVPDECWVDEFNASQLGPVGTEWIYQWLRDQGYAIDTIVDLDTMVHGLVPHLWPAHLQRIASQYHLSPLILEQR